MIFIGLQLHVYWFQSPAFFLMLFGDDTLCVSASTIVHSTSVCRCVVVCNIPEVGELMFEESAQSVSDLEELVSFFVQNCSNAVRSTHSTYTVTHASTYMYTRCNAACIITGSSADTTLNKKVSLFQFRHYSQITRNYKCKLQLSYIYKSVEYNPFSQFFH